MAEVLTCGVYQSTFDVAGQTVSAVQARMTKLWTIPPTAKPWVTGTSCLSGMWVSASYVILPGDRIDFRTPNRSRSVCSECDKPTFTEIQGYPLCHDHYTHTVTHCTEHNWMLDSTEVFHERGKPVFRSFYFCTICNRAVIAKSNESADEAWTNRQRERLLRIEKLLTEDV